MDNLKYLEELEDVKKSIEGSVLNEVKISGTNVTLFFSSDVVLAFNSVNNLIVWTGKKELNG
jgi:hypothetical protein